jgi:hypothetical protein
MKELNRMTLDSSIRAALEEVIDNHLKEPNEMERIYADILGKGGIEPNLETILGFMLGGFWGFSNALHRQKFGRFMNSAEHNAFVALMRRRSRELREAFILAHMGEEG